MLEAKKSLKSQTISGFASFLIQTIGSKAIGLAAQILLARLLTIEDFGMFAMAMTVTAFTDVIRDGGVGTVLVHRGKHFQIWAPLAFPLALVLGLSASLIIAVSGYFIGCFYGDGGAIKLLWVLALAPPINALSTVYVSRLYIDLRFRVLAWYNLLTQSGLVVLAVVFATFGWGSMSFALPYPIIAILGGLLVWWKANVKVHLDWRLRRWRYLLKDSLTILASGFAQSVTARSDYIMLAIFCSTKILGLYYFAFNLSMQIVAILGVQLGAALFPVLAKLGKDKERQGLAFLNASRLMGAIAVPLCLLQGALADPLIPLIFDEKWNEAVPIFQVLSIAMAIRVTGWSFASLLLAQGRFRSRLWLDIAGAIIYLSLVTLAAWLGGPVEVAWAVVVAFAIFRPITLYISLRHSLGNPWSEIRNSLGPTFVNSVIAIGLAMWIGLLINSLYENSLAYVVIVLILSTMFYVPLLYCFDRRIFQDLWGLIRRSALGRADSSG